MNPIFRPERDARQRFDALIWRQPHPKTLRDGCEQKRGFHHREAGPDTDARAAAKRKIRKTRQLRCRFLAPTIRMKTIGFAEPSRVALGHPLTQDDIRPGGQEIVAGLKWFLSPAENPPRRRVEAQRLADHLVRVLQLWKIACRWRPAGGEPGAVRVDHF